jgi:hypothetical protein
MMHFQQLTRSLFLNLHGQNVHKQQRQLSKFLLRYQQFLLMHTAGSARETWTGAAADGVRCVSVR